MYCIKRGFEGQTSKTEVWYIVEEKYHVDVCVLWEGSEHLNVKTGDKSGSKNHWGSPTKKIVRSENQGI